MDIFAHGLWTGVGYKLINKKIKKPFKIKWAVFWGIFPDLFAFTIFFAWAIWGLLYGGLSFSDLPHPDSIEPSPVNTLPINHLTSILYNLSHSLIIFLIVSGIIFLLFRLKSREMPWEIGGWLIHILIDIPTHSYKFYPTPFLWPISEFKFDGITWSAPWFLVLNYIALILTYLILKKETYKNQSS